MIHFYGPKTRMHFRIKLERQMAKPMRRMSLCFKIKNFTHKVRCLKWEVEEIIELNNVSVKRYLQMCPSVCLRRVFFHICLFQSGSGMLPRTVMTLPQKQKYQVIKSISRFFLLVRFLIRMPCGHAVQNKITFHALYKSIVVAKNRLIMRIKLKIASTEKQISQSKPQRLMNGINISARHKNMEKAETEVQRDSNSFPVSKRYVEENLTAF